MENKAKRTGRTEKNIMKRDRKQTKVENRKKADMTKSWMDWKIEQERRIIKVTNILI